jgi:hypothetical protein
LEPSQPPREDPQVVSRRHAGIEFDPCFCEQTLGEGQRNSALFAQTVNVKPLSLIGQTSDLRVASVTRDTLGQ